MSNPELIVGGTFAATIIGMFTQMDAAAFITILLAFMISVGCGWITYKIAIRTVQREIKEAFQVHREQMNADHEEVMSAGDGTANKD